MNGLRLTNKEPPDQDQEHIKVLNILLREVWLHPQRMYTLWLDLEKEGRYSYYICLY